MTLRACASARPFVPLLGLFLKHSSRHRISELAISWHTLDVSEATVRNQTSPTNTWHADFPVSANTTNCDNSHLLDEIVLAIDIVNTGGALEMTRPCPRNANRGDFLDQTPSCFLRVSSLHYCSGGAWSEVRVKKVDEEVDKEANDEFDAPCQETGYGVIVQLQSSRHAAGLVCVVYNFN
ncbi:hypothetical protein GGS23DRAFT_600172 [Durotheca rogersii]|uniref:uncharacterized protein n=1 Tax=Durotheca rogersii TaxID=419775 RepID=UPI00221F9A32|nr:uncharacterized protein GGS23DRAFT_600172 [Durotheca rogersii]KAI5859646.1 hypothetical protein GGS23DRAFT_600172 [Durotheca rogersii]